MFSELKSQGFKYNFYNILGVANNVSKIDIINAYKNKIKTFNNLQLNDEKIHDIKTLKVGLYILINPILRTKYDEQIKTVNMFDDVFKVEKHDVVLHNDDTDRINNNIISDRVFSIPLFTNNAMVSESNFIRNPIQGRIDKTDELIIKNS